MWRLKVALVLGRRRRRVLYSSIPACTAREFDSLGILGDFGYLNIFITRRQQYSRQSIHWRWNVTDMA